MAAACDDHRALGWYFGGGGSKKKKKQMWSLAATAIR